MRSLLVTSSQGSIIAIRWNLPLCYLPRQAAKNAGYVKPSSQPTTHLEYIMKLKLIISTLALSACMTWTYSAMADTATVSASTSQPTATQPSPSTRPDLVKDQKCLKKHKDLMGKPGVKNGVKCRQAHGYKMKDNQKSDQASQPNNKGA